MDPEWRMRLVPFVTGIADMGWIRGERGAGEEQGGEYGHETKIAIGRALWCNLEQL
jgi:hypothetical protein